MRKFTRKSITITLLVALLVSVLPAEFSFAAVPTSISQPAEVTTFKSTENFDQEYLRGYVTSDDDRVLKVIYRTPLETSLFRLSLYRTGADKGDMNLDIFINPKMEYASDGTPTYNFTYYLNMEGLQIPDGRYTIYIRRCATALDAASLKYKNSGVLNKNMVIQVTDGKVKILRYSDVISYNREIMAIGEAYDTSLYLDEKLEDIRFVLRNPVTSIYSDMTWDKISYINTVSDRVTSGAFTDYDKLRKIYEYAASNFYYDSVAFQTHDNQYAHPYDNIRSFEQGLTTVNSQQGRVYTTCQGYSAIVIALARAQGIPARLVYGHRAAVPSHDWTTEAHVNVRDHWWVEAWADGRWIFIDPTVGTTNKYDSSTDKWTTTGLTNYTYFDPTEEQIATSHLYFNIYPDYRYGYYIDNPYEIATLGTFLNQYSEVDPESDDYSYAVIGNQIQNGKIMNSQYSYYDYTTWGDGIKSHFMTDGRGNVSQIQWSNNGFTGALSLPDFTSMKLLSSHGNKYETVDLSGNTALEKVYLYGNNIVSMDLTNCYNAWYVRCKNNPMKELTMYLNGKNRTFTAGDNGTFYFTLDTRYTNSAFSLYSRPDTGYKLEGVYSTGTGNLLSTKKTWHFTPKANGYEIVFKLDPNSYKYTILPGDDVEGAQEIKADYLEAALKRLQELGYYTPHFYEKQTVYTGSMVDAAVKFQVMHDLPNTGNIGKMTWQILFSEDAEPMVSDYEYLQIQADYEARKALEEEAKKVAKAVKIHAASQAASGSMNLTWTTEQVSTGDILLDTEISSLLPLDEGAEAYFDGFEIWKSTSKTSGYKLLHDTISDSADTDFDDTDSVIIGSDQPSSDVTKAEEAGGNTYKDGSSMKKGTRYYYKVRAYKLIGDDKVYTVWSNITYKKAK